MRKFVLGIVVVLFVASVATADVTVSVALKAPKRLAATKTLADYLAGHGVESTAVELPPSWAGQVAEVEAAAAAVIDLGDNPEDAAITGGLLQIKDGVIDALVWNTDAPGATCADLSNCTVVGGAVCALGNSEATTAGKGKGATCVAGCTHAGGTTWRAFIRCNE